jgi:hypothetical protein
MSGSLFDKRVTLLNAIAITLLLALISGYLPIQGLSLPAGPLQTGQSIPPLLLFGK